MANLMQAMILEAPRRPLQLRSVPVPEPAPGQLLIRVLACGVCRTDLHIVDAELADPKLPLIPGHEIVGEVVRSGSEAGAFAPGDRVGVPWLGSVCGTCRYCVSGRENLCDRPGFTGYTIDGGYAEYTVADERFVFPVDPGLDPAEAAPLLCAGLIGYRSWRIAGADAEDVRNVGIYGFGAAAHILTQVAACWNRRVFGFTRPGDREGKELALRVGAVWAGDSTEAPPEELDAAIIFAPVGALVPAALRAVRKGGTVVCGGIHMSDVPSFPYDILWGERSIRSVANLQRRDGEEFLPLASRIPIRTETTVFPLADANEALERLRSSRIAGAAVISISD